IRWFAQFGVCSRGQGVCRRLRGFMGETHLGALTAPLSGQGPSRQYPEAAYPEDRRGIAMQRLIKADFHLHTYHSDNRDRMTPQEYVELGRRLGYDVLGFCDHHHNLTQAAWQTLQAEV